MYFQRLLFVSMVFLGFVSRPATADQFVACVQEQMQDEGIEVGPVDGVLGRKTRAGLSSLRDIYPSLRKLPKLSLSNASVYCREIGLARNSRVGWSSADSIFQLVSGDKISPAVLRKFETSSDNVSKFYFDDLGAILPRSVEIVVSESLDETAELLRASSRAQSFPYDFSEEYEYFCRKRTRCGRSYGGVIAITFSKPSSFPGANIRDYLAHELAHEIQTQYVGNYHYNTADFQIQKRGPLWLIEAPANALGLRFRQSNNTIDHQLKVYEGRHMYSAARLKSFRANSAAREDDFSDYSTYAGLLLASRASHSAFLTFWEKTPELGWEKAFEEAFGETLNEFYDRFEE